MPELSDIKQDDSFRARKFFLSGEKTKGGTPSTINEDERSVELIIASETRDIMAWDWEMERGVPEIMVMSGGVFPENGQVPMIDSHDRWSVKSVLGSVRNFAIEGDKLSGRAFYSSVDSAQEAFTKLKEGHLTDYSVGFRVNKSMRLNEGESTVIAGKMYEGPAILITEWVLTEVSTCPIGADSSAKARMEKTITDKEKKMPEQTAVSTSGRHVHVDEGPHGTDNVNTRDASHAASNLHVDVERAKIESAEKAKTEERERISVINTMCERHECRDMAEAMIRDGKTIDQARAAVLDTLEKREKGRDADMPGFRVEVGLEGRDKFRAAAIDALIVRGGIVALENRSKLALGYDELLGFSLVELARRSLVYANQSDRGAPMDMVGRALTSSDFPLILANIANKSLTLGYESAGETWMQWAGIGSVNDFKIHTMARVSESDDLEEILEDGEYKYGAVNESQEQYAIATYGKMFRISRKAIINDDLSALTDIPTKHGEAAARKIGDIAYAVLIANSAMGDGVALFHASHSNLAAAGTVIGPAGMGEGIKAMGLQKDMKGKRRLNLRPEFVLAPKSIEAASEVFFSSEKFDAGDAGATRTNIYAGTKYTRIYDARLDDASLTSWYLLSTKGKTVKVFFLGGNMTPYMESRQGWNVDGIEYKVRIDAGAKALDWKTMYKNPGA